MKNKHLITAIAVLTGAAAIAQNPISSISSNLGYYIGNPTVTRSVNLESGKLVVISRSEYPSNAMYTSYPSQQVPPLVTLRCETYGASNGVVVLESVETGKEVPAVTVTETKTITPATNIWTKVP
jgi:hypothetical protein